MLADFTNSVRCTVWLFSQARFKVKDFLNNFELLAICLRVVASSQVYATVALNCSRESVTQRKCNSTSTVAKEMFSLLCFVVLVWIAHNTVNTDSDNYTTYSKYKYATNLSVKLPTQICNVIVLTWRSLNFSWNCCGEFNLDLLLVGR